MDFAKNMIAGQIKDKVSSQVSNMSKEKSNINWEDLNFPPILKLFHFSLTEISGNVRKTVLIIYISFIIICFVCFVNCINK